MNRTLIIGVVIAAAITAAFFALGRSGSDVTNAPARGTTIVAFGDSLVEGVGATRGNDFVSVLSRMSGIPIGNLGRSGDTTASGLARLDDLMQAKPDIVLLLLGGNDFLRNVPKDEIFRNLSLIIDRLQAEGSVVILLGVRGGIFTDEFQSDFERLAKAKKTAFVPNVLDGILGKQELMSDNIHPNDAGYKIIAEKIYPVLAEVLP